MPTLGLEEVLIASCAAGVALLISQECNKSAAAVQRLEDRLNRQDERDRSAGRPVQVPAAAAGDAAGDLMRMLREQEERADRKLDRLRAELATATTATPPQPLPPTPPTPPTLILEQVSSTPPPAAQGGSAAQAQSESEGALDHLARENKRLASQLSRIRREHWRRGLLLDLETDMTPEEEVEVRRIFDMYDTNRNGSIFAQDLQALHLKMGEPLTDVEAAVALREMAGDDAPELEEVSFETFLTWWKRTHKNEVIELALPAVGETVILLTSPLHPYCY